MLCYCFEIIVYRSVVFVTTCFSFVRSLHNYILLIPRLSTCLWTVLMIITSNLLQVRYSGLNAESDESFSAGSQTCAHECQMYWSPIERSGDLQLGIKHANFSAELWYVWHASITVIQWKNCHLTFNTSLSISLKYPIVNTLIRSSRNLCSFRPIFSYSLTTLSALHYIDISFLIKIKPNISHTWYLTHDILRRRRNSPIA